MTLEAARAILGTNRREASLPTQTDHVHADRFAFAARMARLRPRKFLRIVTRAR